MCLLELVVWSSNNCLLGGELVCAGASGSNALKMIILFSLLNILDLTVKCFD